MAIQSIGIDIRHANPQGAGKGRYSLEITKSLIETAPANLHFYLFTHEANPLFTNLADPSKVSQITIPGRSLFWHLTLRRYLLHHPVDYFLAPTSYLYPALAPKKQKVITVVHDLISFLYPHSHAWFPTLVERVTLRRAIEHSQMMICVSSSTAHDLARCFPESYDKPILLAPPAVSAEVHRIHTQKMDLPKDFILGVGTLSPRKNLQTLFKAFTHLADKQRDLHVVIAGAKGWKTSGIYKTIPKSLKKRIHFLGYVSSEKLNELYSRARFLVFPSLYEGFGIPPLEAMACGCPVIVSNTSALPEVVGDAALKFPPNDEKALAECMMQMLSPHNQEVYKKRGFKQVLHFSWKESAKKIHAALATLSR